MTGIQVKFKMHWYFIDIYMQTQIHTIMMPSVMHGEALCWVELMTPWQHGKHKVQTMASKPWQVQAGATAEL